jgi:esterase/lipase superfamily enzyme
MDDTPNWIELIAASGIGGLIVAFAQGALGYFSETRSRSFAERKAAYSEYLVALNQSQTTLSKPGEHPNQWYSDLKRAELMCEVMGSSKVRDAIKELEASNHDHDESRRTKAKEGVVAAIRLDLDVAK